MYMNKKKMFSLAVVVIMIAILSFSSLAWFSDVDKVTNNFTVDGGENEKLEEIFSLDVMEAVDADGDGDYDNDDATIGYDKDPNPKHEFTYEDILPGDMLLKRPQAKNTGAYPMYVRFKVTVDNAEDWEKMLDQYGYKLHDLLYNTDKTTKLTDSPNWTFAPAETVRENDKITYVFYYNNVLDEGRTATLFGYVKIPGELTQNDMALFTEGKFQMVVTGEAVQAEHTGTNAQEAFAKVEGSGQALDQVSR